MESLDALSSCCVCFEGFDLNVHIPRILPCSHSLCHICITNLLTNSNTTLECAECRQQHNVGSEGAKTFPQNKYIVTHLQRQLVVPPDHSAEPAAKCEGHGKEFSLFCLSLGCMKPLCTKCLRDHKLHDIADLADAPLELINKGKQHLNSMKERLNTNKCVQLESLERAKDNAIKRITQSFEMKKSSLHGRQWQKYKSS